MLEFVIPIAGAALGAFIPMIMDGVERKIRATLHSRIGPPILQTLYDIRKLMIKETKGLHTLNFAVFYVVISVMCNIASMSFMLAYALTGDPLSRALSLALLVMGVAAYVSAPLLVPNPFSHIGAMREVILSLVNEFALISSAAIFINGLSIAGSKNIAAFALIPAVSILFISSYVATGRPPFDLAEAEPELASGTAVEFSGKALALYIYALLVKRLAVKICAMALLITPLLGAGALAFMATYASSIALWCVFGTVAVVLGRSRIDLAPLSLAKIYIALLALSITVLLVITYA